MPSIRRTGASEVRGTGPKAWSRKSTAAYQRGAPTSNMEESRTSIASSLEEYDSRSILLSRESLRDWILIFSKENVQMVWRSGLFFHSCFLFKFFLSPSFVFFFLRKKERFMVFFLFWCVFCGLRFVFLAPVLVVNLRGHAWVFFGELMFLCSRSVFFFWVLFVCYGFGLFLLCFLFFCVCVFAGFVPWVVIEGTKSVGAVGRVWMGCVRFLFVLLVFYGSGFLFFFFFFFQSGFGLFIGVQLGVVFSAVFIGWCFVILCCSETLLILVEGFCR